MHFSIADSIATRCFAHPDRVAVQVVGTQEEVTYGELWRRVAVLAEVAAGCAPGRHGRMVGLLLPNCPDAAFVIAACQQAGAVAVPVNRRLTPSEARYVLENADCRLLMTAGGYLDAAKAAADPLNIPVVSVDDVETPSHAPRPVLGKRDVGAEPCVIGYTSGTTGFPKGAVYTHDYYTMNNYRWGWQFGLTAEQVVLITGPMFHLSYAGFALAGLTIGARVRIMAEFSAGVAADELQQRSTFAFLVPSMLDMVAEEWEARGRPPLAGATSRRAPRRGWRCCAPRWRCSPMLGSRKCTAGPKAPSSPMKSRTRPPWWRPVSAGPRSAPMSPCSTTTASPARWASRGRSACAAPFLSPAIWTMRKRHGLSSTGVICSPAISGAGCPTVGSVWSTARKDVIITGGENVYGAEVERILLRHEAVAEAAVVGIPDQRWGQRVVAVLVAKEGAEADPDGVMDFCREHLAGYKVPRVVRFAGELPRNAMGKILKFEVAELFTGGA